MKAEQAALEARKSEETAVRLSQDAASRADEAISMARKVSEEVNQLTGELSPRNLVNRVLSSGQFRITVLIIALASIMAAVGISVGLSLLKP